MLSEKLLKDFLSRFFKLKVSREPAHLLARMADASKELADLIENAPGYTGQEKIDLKNFADCYRLSAYFENIVSIILGGRKHQQPHTAKTRTKGSK